jgi:hypothetical protein
MFRKNFQDILSFEFGSELDPQNTGLPQNTYLPFFLFLVGACEMTGCVPSQVVVSAVFDAREHN